MAEMPLAGVIQCRRAFGLAIRRKDGSPSKADGGVGVHAFDDLGQRFWAVQIGVRIEKKRIAALALRKAKVATPAESQVFCADNEATGPVPDFIPGVILAGVIHHQDFVACANLAGDGLQAGVDTPGGVEGDNDDADIHGMMNTCESEGRRRKSQAFEGHLRGSLRGMKRRRLGTIDRCKMARPEGAKRPYFGA